jgi:hypothetical protein
VEDMRNKYILVGTPEGKRKLGKPRHGGENNFRIDLNEIGRERNYEQCNEPSVSLKGRSSLVNRATVSFSRTLLHKLVAVVCGRISEL